MFKFGLELRKKDLSKTKFQLDFNNILWLEKNISDQRNKLKKSLFATVPGYSN